MDKRKLLPGTSENNNGGAIVLAKSNIIPRPKRSIVRKSSLIKKPIEETSETKSSKKRLLDINKLVQNNLFTSRKRYKNRFRSIQKQRKEERENLLEKRKFNPKTTNVAKPEMPKTGLLDGVKNYISNVLMGILFTNIQKVTPIVKNVFNGIKPIIGFIASVSEGILNGLVNFITVGYRAYDQTRKWIGEKYGEKGTENFDKIIKTFDTFLIGAVGVAVALAKKRESPLPPPPPCPSQPSGRNLGYSAGSGLSGRYRPEGQTRAGSNLKLEGARRGITQERMMQYQGPNGPLDRISRGIRGASAQFETTPVGRFVGRTKAKMPGVPGGTSWMRNTGRILRLIGLGFLAAEIKQDYDRGDTKAIVVKLTAYGLGWLVSGLMIAKGSALSATGVGAAAGIPLIAGSVPAGMAVDYGVRSMFGYAQGGEITRNGKPVGGPIRRRLPSFSAPNLSGSKYVSAQKTDPGKDIGGMKNLEKVFPNPKDSEKKPNAMKVLKKASSSFKNIGSIDGIVGAISGIPIDAIMGQKTNSMVIREIGEGFGSYIEREVNKQLNQIINTMQNGGENLSVNPYDLKSKNIGKRIGANISMSFASAINFRVNEILGELKMQYSKDKSKKDEQGGGGGKTPGPGGSPAGELPGGILPGDAPPEVKAMLEAIASKEGGWESVNSRIVIKGLSKMTISQAIREGQRIKREGRGSGALGKFQQKFEYLDDRSRKAKLNPDKDLFSPENQTLISRVYLASVYGGEAKLIADAKKDPLIVAKKLNGVWPSLPGGNQQLQNEKQFKQTYTKSLEKYGLLQEGSTSFTGGVKPSVVLGSKSGDRFHPIDQVWKTHTGNDYPMNLGTPITILKGGQVTKAGWIDGYGYSVEITHPDGTKSFYGHLSAIKVGQNQTITSGTVIGNVGSTGKSTGSHVHFEYVTKDNKKVLDWNILNGIADRTFVFGNVKPSIVYKLSLKDGKEGIIENGVWKEKKWTEEERKRYYKVYGQTQSPIKNQGVVFKSNKFYQKGGGILGLDEEIKVTDEQNTQFRSLPSFLGKGKKEGEVRKAPDGMFYYWNGTLWKEWTKFKGANANANILQGSSINAEIAFNPLPLNSEVIKETPSYDQSSKEIIVMRQTTIVREPILA